MIRTYENTKVKKDKVIPKKPQEKKPTGENKAAAGSTENK